MKMIENSEVRESVHVVHVGECHHNQGMWISTAMGTHLCAFLVKVLVTCMLTSGIE